MKKDTLVIIGNGFDLWQNLKTGYKDFYKYYRQHRFEICKKLRIKEVTVQEGNKIQKITPVELIYGDILDQDLAYFDFWNTFEDSLGYLDAYNLNLYYGKEPEVLNDFLKSGRNAQKILRTAFCNWVQSLNIKDKKRSNIKFKDNCLFINFNYTSTLQDLFGVSEDDVIHIHGEAADKKSIIFGHSNHPQEPEDIFRSFGGRFYGLYIVESLLFETDKQVRTNITELCIDLSLTGVIAEDIKDIYVLGHSLGQADYEYFRFLKSAASLQSEYEKEAKINLKRYNPDDDLQLRMNYAQKKYGGDFTIIEPVTKKEKFAVLKKLLFEQSKIDEYIIKDYVRALNKNSPQKIKLKDLQPAPEKLLVNQNRKQDAKWHISCFTKEDEDKAAELMKKIHCKNYELYKSIDDAIQNIIK